MKTVRYTPKGVCSRLIEIDLEGSTVRAVRFEGGCAGNTQGIAALIRDMDAKEAASRLAGIRCGFKSTSCPDQLSKALIQALEQAEA